MNPYNIDHSSTFAITNDCIPLRIIILNCIGQGFLYPDSDPKIEIKWLQNFISQKLGGLGIWACHIYDPSSQIEVIIKLYRSRSKIKGGQDRFLGLSGSSQTYPKGRNAFEYFPAFLAHFYPNSN